MAKKTKKAKTPLRIGLIGPGQIADQQLIPALNALDSGQFWSVLSRDRARASAFAQKHGAKSPDPAHADLSTFLADRNMDAVIIASPDRLHASQAIAAANAGKHILVEKPMASSCEEAQQMLKAAEAADVRLGVAYHLRWHAGHRLLAKQIREGALGTLQHFRAHWTFVGDKDNWRAGDETGRWWSLASVGTHMLDLARFFMIPSCGNIDAIQGLTSNKRYGLHDESAAISLLFSSGATAQITASVLYKSPRFLEIHGDKASAICHWTLGPKGEGTIRVGDELLDFKAENPYTGEIADFIAAVREKRSPEVDAKEGLRNVRLLEHASGEALLEL